MPTTPTYGLPYPALSDPPNVPADLQALAEAVDTAIGTAIDGLRTELLGALAVTAGTIIPADDHGQAVAEAWEDWGAERIIIPNPGKPVYVVAVGSGHAYNDTGGTINRYAAIRVGISLDGAASYSYGNGPRDKSAPEGTWSTSPSSHLVTGTPSGDIVVKAQHQSSSTSSRFFNGRVIALVLPQQQ